MKLAWALMLLIPAGAQAQAGPSIAQCNRVEQAYGQEMVDFYFLLAKNSKDRGPGRVDPALVTDIYFALVEGKQFVHNEIQHIQLVIDEGLVPPYSSCNAVRAVARAEIEHYARYLLSEVDPADRELRDIALQEFRLELRRASRRLRGY